MFDEDIAWALSRGATDRIVSQLQATGLNVYVPCVWHGRGSYYPTRLTHQDERIASRLATGDDPLTYLLERAHRVGIEVHPWFTVMRREDNRYPAFFSPETPPESYDVHNGEFRSFVVQLMVDLVRRYPVDGVNLDYIRSMGICVCNSCSTTYASKTGRNLIVDRNLLKVPGTRLPSMEHWNGEAVSSIVRDFAVAARQARPGLVISVDAHPGTDDWLGQGQDSPYWHRNGWVDVVYAMDYRKKLDPAYIRRAVTALGEPQALTMLVAIYDLVDQAAVTPEEQSRNTGSFNGKAIVARNPLDLVEFVRQGRKLWPGGGIAFYHLPRLTNEQSRELRSTVFPESCRPAWPKRHSSIAEAL